MQDKFRTMRQSDLFFSITGRIGRVRFLVCYLLLAILSISLFVAAAYTFQQAGPNEISAPIIIIFIWPSVSIWVKRLHDLDYSGFWLLVLIVPFIGLAVVIAAFLMPGTKGSNKYGPAPNVVPIAAYEPEGSSWSQ